MVPTLMPISEVPTPIPKEVPIPRPILIAEVPTPNPREVPIPRPILIAEVPTPIPEEIIFPILPIPYTMESIFPDCIVIIRDKDSNYINFRNKVPTFEEFAKLKLAHPNITFVKEIKSNNDTIIQYKLW